MRNILSALRDRKDPIHCTFCGRIERSVIFVKRGSIAMCPEDCCRNHLLSLLAARIRFSSISPSQSAMDLAESEWLQSKKIYLDWAKFFFVNRRK